VEEEIQVDPKLRTEKCYVKLTAQFIRKELILNKGYDFLDFSRRSINNILNRLGYGLKKVLKTKPLKKIPETDAIFSNIKSQHALAKKNRRILRISIDVKDKVKIGNLSRGGYSRLQNAPIADDHDQHWDAKLVPFGIHEMNTNNVFLVFGNSKETSDFIGDALEIWWDKRQFESTDYDLLMIDLDNGSSVSSRTRLFQKRIVQFAEKIGLPIRLVYYPPYHSKYNPIERFWAALEKYWKPIILDTIDNTLKVAQQVIYKTMNPIVLFLDRIYETGIKVSDDEFKEFNKFIIRDPKLPKWNVFIKPKSG